MALGQAIAAAIAKLRKGRVTKLLDNPPELVAAAQEVARGAQSLDALSAALPQANLASKGSGHFDGLLFPLDSAQPYLSRIAPLLNAKKLVYGIVVTHTSQPNSGWAIPVAFVWFNTDLL